MSDMVELDQAEAEELAMQACLRSGAGQASARSLVDATISAARFGPATVGFPHIVELMRSKPLVQAGHTASN